jgi:hypothetical protein
VRVGVLFLVMEWREVVSLPWLIRLALWAVLVAVVHANRMTAIHTIVRGVGGRLCRQ